jgi:hypothetical protein
MTPRQRLKPPADLTDPIIDYVVYTCPIRNQRCFALEDRHGQWWTAPRWHHGGHIGFFHKGGASQLSIGYPYHENDNTDLSRTALYTLEWVNQERPDVGGIFQYYEPTDHSMEGHADTNNRFCQVNYAWVGLEQLGSDGMIQQRVLNRRGNATIFHHIYVEWLGDDNRTDIRNQVYSDWKAAFNHCYPAPPDARLDSYTISLRSAAARHAAACRAKRSRHKHRQFSLTFTND